MNIKKHFHKKSNLAILSILSLSLFASTLTAAPLTTSYNLPYDSSLAQPVAVNANSVGEIKEQAQAKTTSTNGDATTSTPAAQAPSQTVTTTATRPQVQKTSSRSTSVSYHTPSSSSNQSAAAILATAKHYLGVKYVWGGTTPSGFDCSGFTQYVFAQHGISLPRVSRDQYNVGTSVSFNNLQPGDLVFFSLGQDKVIDHEGIYVGNGQFINASTSKGVTIYSLGQYWKSHYVGAKRVL